MYVILLCIPQGRWTNFFFFLVEASVLPSLQQGYAINWISPSITFLASHNPKSKIIKVKRLCRMSRREGKCPERLPDSTRIQWNPEPTLDVCLFRKSSAACLLCALPFLQHSPAAWCSSAGQLELGNQ